MAVPHSKIFFLFRVTKDVVTKEFSYSGLLNFYHLPKICRWFVSKGSRPSSHHRNNLGQKEGSNEAYWPRGWLFASKVNRTNELAICNSI